MRKSIESAFNSSEYNSNYLASGLFFMEIASEPSTPTCSARTVRLTFTDKQISKRFRSVNNLTFAAPAFCVRGNSIKVLICLRPCLVALLWSASTAYNSKKSIIEATSNAGTAPNTSTR